MEKFQIEAILALKDNLSKGLSTATASLGTLGGAVSKATSATSSFSSKAGGAMTGAGAAVTAFGSKSLKEFGTFEMSLNKAAVVAGGTSKDIDGLADVANRMGAELPISAQDAADAMIEMAQNGASLDSIKKQFPAIAQASTAAGEDLQVTAGVVQQAMTIWGDSLESPEQAASILVQTANMSNASIGDMKQALATIGGTAKSAGLGLDETAQAIGLMTNQGFTAAEASQDLNHAILQMLAPSDTAKKTMAQLGLSFVDSNGKMKPFKQILLDTAKATEGMGEAQKIAALKNIFHTSGMKAMLPLMDSVKNNTGDATKSWDAYAKKIQETSGTTEAAKKTLQSQADDMQQNVGSKIEQVGGNWEALRNKAMSSEKGMSSAMLDNINDMLEWATTSDSKTAEIARSFVGLSPVIGPALSAVGMGLMGFSGILKVVSGTAKIAGLAIKGISAAAGFIGKGISAATGKLFGFSSANDKAAKSSDDVGKKSRGSSGGIKQMQAEAKSTMMTLAGFGMAAAGVGVGIGAATLGLSKLIDSLKGLAEIGTPGITILTILSTTFATVAVAMVPLLNNLTAGGAKGRNFRKGLEELGNTALKIGGSIAMATTGFTMLISAITELSKQGEMGIATLVTTTAAISTLAGVFALLGPRLNVAIPGMTAFSGVIISTGAAVTAINLSLSVLISTIGDVITRFAAFGVGGDQIIKTLQNIGEGLGKMIGSFLVASAEAIPKLITTLISGLDQVMSAIASKMPNFVQNGLKIVMSIVQGLVKGIPELVKNALLLITKFVEALAKGIPQLIKTGLDLVVNVLKGLTQGLPKVLKAGVDLVVNILKGITQNLPRILDAGVKLVITFVQSIAKNIGKIVSAGINLISKFLDGMAKEMPKILTSVVNLITKFVDGIVKNLPKIIDSAVKLIGAFLDGLAKAIPKIADKAIDAVLQFTYGVGKTLGKVLTSGDDLIANFIKGIADGISGSNEKGKENGRAVAEGIKSFSLVEVGKDMIVGFWNGIVEKWNWLVSKVQRMTSDLVNSFKSALGIHSPSRVMRDEVGRFVSQGIGIGMTKEIPWLSKQTQSLVSAITPNAPDIGVSISPYVNDVKLPKLNDFNLSNEIKGVNGNLSTETSQFVNVTTANKQPAYINIQIGKTRWKEFVEDITDQQNFNSKMQNLFGGY